MMKKVFWILVLANVAFFGAMRMGSWGEQTQQALPPLHENMIRLVGEPRIPPVAALPAPVPMPAPVPVSAPVPASAPVPVSAPVPAAAPVAASSPVAAKPGALVCLEWGEFSGTDLEKATAALTELQLGDRLTQHRIEYDTGYWVYIPPLKNRAAINRKINELKARGIREYFVVQDESQWRNAISLGVFKTQEAAQHYLDELRGKAVRSAQVGQRASKFKVTRFSLKGVGILIEAKMTAMQKEFPGSELKHVPCTLTR